jgi:hypothetical protein
MIYSLKFKKYNHLLCRFLWPSGCLTAGIAGSSPAEGITVCLLYLLCVVQLAASAMSGSLFQRSHTGVYVCV